MAVISVAYLMALPTAFEVRSDGSIGVVMVLLTYTFPDVVRAYQLENLCDAAFRPRMKFLTDLDSRVCIERSRCCDLLVSPKDVD
eukprot:CAMPEP_0116857424 /NCGR_PEP_ID=MMETSP0418-20121206/20536_1 /TAXON_ID=1158023 /ORGANISM="Astrosyne radiata, Strain 13vi08-1A" /LENGTH=84 /DNA_ID=CAMNT_0004491087 /DNA_START=40 /DNA_END=291 /DNA_ORIENTATION=-